MAESKIAVTIGDVSFSGEGEQVWLTELFEKVIKAAPELAQVQTPKGKSAQSENGETIPTDKFNATLASYIKKKGAESNQVDRFLATADWLRCRGAEKLTTASVSKALKDNHQKRLANAADCLNKNVSKGYCEKADGGFFITPDGLKKLGHE